VAVQAFLTDRISFLQMPEVIEKIMEKASFIKNPDLEDYIRSDKEVRILTAAQIKKLAVQKN
jgi:1-deoxy-D-xylulose-5-phosphate reductoisomerase